MRKRRVALSGAALTALLLTGCGSDDGAGDDGDAADSAQGSGEQDGADGPPASGDEFDDQLGLALGEVGYVSTTVADHAFTVEGVEFLGFDALVEEHDANVHPSYDPEFIAVVDVTLENVDETDIEAQDTVDMLEFGPAEGVENDEGGEGQAISAGDPEFDVAGLFEGTVEPGEVMSGKLYFPVFDWDADEDRWGVTISRGVEACCTDNDLSWIFDAEPTVGG